MAYTIPHSIGDKVYYIQTQKRSFCFVCNVQRMTSIPPRVTEGRIRTINYAISDTYKRMTFTCTVEGTSEIYSISKVFKNKKAAEAELKKGSVTNPPGLVFTSDGHQFLM